MTPRPTLTRKRRLSAGAGKTNFELARITSGKTTLDGTGVVYITTREEIESEDLSRFLENFSLKSSPDRLRKLQSKVLFTVDGYDEESDPLFAIPAVRRFYSKCHLWWPCWSFFADLQTECLATVACCIVPNLAVVQQPRRRKLEVTLLQPDLISFFETGLPPAAFLHAKVGLDKLTGMKLLQAVSFYLQLPDR